MREDYLSLSKALPSRTDAFQITLSANILTIITCTVVATSSIYTLSYIVHHLDLDHHDVGVLRWIVLCWTKKCGHLDIQSFIVVKIYLQNIAN